MAITRQEFWSVQYRAEREEGEYMNLPPDESRERAKQWADECTEREYGPLVPQDDSCSCSDPNCQV